MTHQDDSRPMMSMTSHREDFFAGDGNKGTGEPTSQDDDVTGWFDRVAEKADLVQTETLRRIIEINRGTEYLSRWLGKDLRLEDLELGELETVYSSLVPLASHADFEPYLQRIMDGEASPILTRDTISAMSRRYPNLLVSFGHLYRLSTIGAAIVPVGS